MSTGMRQKLALAVTLAAETPLLILDEPTANLDPSVRASVLEMVTEAQHAGRTVILSSHVLSEVEEVCNRVAILRQGAVVHSQNMSALRRQHRLRATLSGPMPEIPAKILDGLSICETDDLTIDIVAEELSPLLGWLASLPVDEVSVEPVGLRPVYDRFHRDQVRNKQNGAT